MKKVVMFLLAMAGMGVVASAAYIDVTTSNTARADGSGAAWATDANAKDTLWRFRADQMGGIYEAGDDTCPVLVTTLSGLTPGQKYQVDVIYYTKKSNENWNVTVSFDPITEDQTTGAVTSGITYGAVAATVAGVDIVAGTGTVTGSIVKFTGLVGNATADANGQILVYADDLANNQSVNYRTWLDGYEVTAVPEPVTMAMLGLGGLVLSRRRK